MNDKFQKLISDLNTKTQAKPEIWDKTAGENCIHTFFQSYGVRICKYDYFNGVTAINFAILDMNGSNIDEIDFFEEEENDKIEFSTLLTIFNAAKRRLINLDSIINTLIEEVNN